MDDYSALLKLNDSEDVIHISGRLRDVSGLKVGTPIRNNSRREVIGYIDRVDLETNTYTGVVHKSHWESLIGEKSLGFSMEISRE